MTSHGHHLAVAKNIRPRTGTRGIVVNEACAQVREDMLAVIQLELQGKCDLHRSGLICSGRFVTGGIEHRAQQGGKRNRFGR